MSDKSIAEKLQVKGARTLGVIAAPDAILQALATAPTDSADVVLVFVTTRADLSDCLPNALRTIRADAIFWLAYPKLTSRFAGDLNRDLIRALAPDYGLDTVSQIAIDDDWSALRLKRVP